jgi:hypothetical protein
MMRTVETILVVMLLIAALTTSLFATWPSLRHASSQDLRRIALTTLETLDADNSLSETVFKPSNDSAWDDLQLALASCLPPNIVYNLTVYLILNGSSTDPSSPINLYSPINSISNSKSLAESTNAASYLVTHNATYSVTTRKIGGTYGGTLYMLNCSDASGWWITGYTGQSLADDLLNLLSPYFQQTVVVQNTTQLGQILNGTALQNETLLNAVVCNVFGEAVPIPQGYYTSTNVGYDPPNNSYARYCYTLGQRVRQYNWTWVSIVGWPLYYVSNTAYFSGTQNSYGIYGMSKVSVYGRTAFLQGLDNQNYSFTTGEGIGSQSVVSLTPEARDCCDKYGLYPNPSQTASRSMPSAVLSNYHLSIAFQMFNAAPDGSIGGALFSNSVSGSLLALGLTRTPDVRLTALGLLGYYNPALDRPDPTHTSSSRLVILSVGRMGGT